MKASRLKVLSLAAVGALLLLAPHAGAYVRMQNQGQNLYWHSMPMQFNIDNSSALPGVSAAAFQAAIRASYQTWSNVSCSYFKTQDLGLVSNKNGNKSDGKNTNTVPSSWNQSPNALGVTMTYMYGAKISDADTVYNPGRTWSTTGSYSAIDVQAVATHEIGHQLGLDHPPVPAATMYYAIGAGNLGPRSLHSDDIAGLCAIYPSGSQPPPECTKDTDCAQGEKCQSNKCVTGSTGSLGYGSPCSSNQSCKSTLCLQDSYGKTFCSEFCDTTACPNGDQCVTVSVSGKTYKVCSPGSSSWGKTKLGQACTSSVECEDKYCAPVSGKGYLCARKCDTATPCPTGYTCTNYKDSQGATIGLCVPSTTPPPSKKKMGEACTKHADCDTNVCLNTGNGPICTRYCPVTGTNTCPSGWSCAKTTTGQGICVKGTTPPPPIQKGDFGDPCTSSDECKSNLCVNGEMCTKLCDPNNPSSACGAKYGCLNAGGVKFVCYGDPPGGGNTDYVPVSEESGCELAPAGRGPEHLLLLLLLLPVMIMLRRRR